MLDWLFRDFDFSRIHVHVVWWMITYGALLFAMFIDFLTGLRKAKKAGIATPSRAMRKSCKKATKYFAPMLCLMPVDILASQFLPLPAFTMLMAAFNIYCEWVSVFEKTHTKREIHDAANTVSVIVKNKDDLAKVFAEVLVQMAKEEAVSVEAATVSPHTNEGKRGKARRERRATDGEK